MLNHEDSYIRNYYYPIYIYATQPIQLQTHLNIYRYTLTTTYVTSTLNCESTVKLKLNTCVQLRYPAMQ